jgi:ATP-dependent helicase/DNAse subunit B
MRKFVTAVSTRDRLKAAADFLTSYSDQERLLVSATRTAGDELLRGICSQAGFVFGVHRFTVPQLAIQIATTRLIAAGKTVLAGVAVDALAASAVHSCRQERELAWFEPVANTPGFFRALAATITELRLNNVDHKRLKGSGAAGQDVANLLRRYNSHLEENKLADLAIIFDAATKAVLSDEWTFRKKIMVFLDVAPTSVLEQAFLSALASQGTDVLATAHDRDKESLDRWSGILDVKPASISTAENDSALSKLRSHVFRTDSPSNGELDDSVHFISATDESRECVEIARSILAASNRGVPFDHMAVVLRNPDLYQPLLEDALRRARIPGFYTRGTRRPNPAGRALLALLACASEKLSATRFSEYLSLGQIPDTEPATEITPKSTWVAPQGELFAEVATEEEPSPVDVPPHLDAPVAAGTLRTPRHWERLIVDAAVIGGHDRWSRRLDGLRQELRKRMVELGDEDDASRQRLERELRQLHNLQKFALPIISFLDRLPASATWGTWLDNLEQLATLALRRPEGVLMVLAELRPMSGIGPVALDEVREALADRLSFLRTEPTERRYGKVFVATIPEILGLSFDTIFLPGLGEDIFPKKSFEDPLLLDAVRSEVSPFLSTQEVRFSRERQLLHTVAGATVRQLWLSYPRMDMRQGRARGPSFYALDVLRAVSGRVPQLRELQQKSADASYSQIGWPAPRDPNHAIDDAEFDLAVISQALHDPEKAHGYGRYLMAVSEPLARSLRARWSRWQYRWSPADGLILNADEPAMKLIQNSRLSARPYSATALQHFAACPYRFLLNSVYHLQPRDERVPLERMDALTRGSLFHTLQFRLFSRLKSLSLLPITGQNYSTIYAIADEVLAEVAEAYREETAPAIPRIWDAQIEEIRWDVRGWLRHVAILPKAGNWTQTCFELAFGLHNDGERDPQSSSTPVRLPDGTELRGAIDLIEENAEEIRVTDHKTGRAPSKRVRYIGEGEVLQPLLYAQAAEALLKKKARSTRLYYCTERGQYTIVEIQVDEEGKRTLETALHSVDESIAAGFLPAAPRRGACEYCDYRIVCGPYEELRTNRKPKDRLRLLTQLREMS